MSARARCRATTSWSLTLSVVFTVVGVVIVERARRRQECTLPACRDCVADTCATYSFSTPKDKLSSWHQVAFGLAFHCCEGIRQAAPEQAPWVVRLATRHHFSQPSLLHRLPWRPLRETWPACSCCRRQRFLHRSCRCAPLRQYFVARRQTSDAYKENE